MMLFTLQITSWVLIERLKGGLHIFSREERNATLLSKVQKCCLNQSHTACKHQTAEMNATWQTSTEGSASSRRLFSFCVRCLVPVELVSIISISWLPALPNLQSLFLESVCPAHLVIALSTQYSKVWIMWWIRWTHRDWSDTGYETISICKWAWNLLLSLCHPLFSCSYTSIHSLQICSTTTANFDLLKLQNKVKRIDTTSPIQQ